jgi:hypothetical protein
LLWPTGRQKIFVAISICQWQWLPIKQFLLNYKFEQVIPAAAVSESRRVFQDTPGSVTWYNSNRTDAYTLSPWSQTLVLDADYVVASNQLATLLSIDKDFIAHQTAYDVTGHPEFNENNYFGRNRMPMSWATVMMFRRSRQAEMIFECMAMIKKNWHHYTALYGVNRPTYRNDYALSIALNIVSGHTQQYPCYTMAPCLSKPRAYTHTNRARQVSCRI